MVTLFKSSLLIAWESFLEWKKDYRIWVLFSLTGLILVRYLYGVNLYGFDYHTKVTPFLLPLLFGDSDVANGLVKMLLMLGAVCLFSNAPFSSDIAKYQVLRAGKRAWWVGKCLYIWVASFVYISFIALFSGLFVLPTADMGDLWGSTLKDWLAGKNGWGAYAGQLTLPFEMIRVLYPAGAQILTFFSASLTVCVIGHLIYFVNLLTNSRSWGIGCATMLVMIDPVIHYFAFTSLQRWMYKINPVSWCSIELWTVVGSGKPLSAQFVFSADVLLIAALIIGILTISNRERAINSVFGED